MTLGGILSTGNKIKLEMRETESYAERSNGVKGVKDHQEVRTWEVISLSRPKAWNGSFTKPLQAPQVQLGVVPLSGEIHNRALPLFMSAVK